MDIRIEEENVKIVYVYIDDFKIEHSRITKIIDKLSDCDGHIKSLSINDDDLKEHLLNYQIIKVTHRNGWYPGKNFNLFKDIIYGKQN